MIKIFGQDFDRVVADLPTAYMRATPPYFARGVLCYYYLSPRQASVNK